MQQSPRVEVQLHRRLIMSQSTSRRLH
uniref:Uncharacterized protein n=1 Tax=Megaselia scalaris TaxID=36166 RepID=T1H383_MEGSC